MIKIRRNFKRRERRLQGTKGAQKQRNSLACENFAAKRAPLRKGASHTKLFRSQKDHAAKLRSCCETSPPSLPPLPCEIISQPQATPYENFCSRETPLKHTCAISQPKCPFRSCKMACETLQSQIS